MVYIRKAAIEHFIPLAVEQFNGKISLFALSSSDAKSLTKIELGKLSLEERKKLGQEHRFVAVIEIGDQIFAHMHANYVDQLKGVENLTLDGKKITVQALTNEQAAKLSLVGETFEDSVLKDVNNEDHESNGNNENQLKKGGNTRTRLPREFHASKELISDQVRVSQLLFTQLVKFELDNIITKSLQEFNKAQVVERKQKAEDDLRSEIRSDAIKAGIKKEEIKKEDIQTKEKRTQAIDSDVKSKHRTRGGSI